MYDIIVGDRQECETELLLAGYVQTGPNTYRKPLPNDENTIRLVTRPESLRGMSGINRRAYTVHIQSPRMMAELRARQFTVRRWPMCG